MKLYLVHCGFYDKEISDGVYESHVNFFVAAKDFAEARAKVKEYPAFKAKRMHVDGLQEVEAVNGYRVALEKDMTLSEESIITSHRHRDLAPSK